MPDLGRLTVVEGSNLLSFIAAVRVSFLARHSYEEASDGCRRPNSVRRVTVELFDDLSRYTQIAIIEDLLYGGQDVEFVRPPAAVFETADSPAAHIVDLVCEVVWQALMCEPEIRVQDEVRAVLTAAA